MELDCCKIGLVQLLEFSILINYYAMDGHLLLQDRTYSKMNDSNLRMNYCKTNCAQLLQNFELNG